MLRTDNRQAGCNLPGSKCMATGGGRRGLATPLAHLPHESGALLDEPRDELADLFLVIVKVAGQTAESRFDKAVMAVVGYQSITGQRRWRLQVLVAKQAPVTLSTTSRSIQISNCLGRMLKPLHCLSLQCCLSTV